MIRILFAGGLAVFCPEAFGAEAPIGSPAVMPWWVWPLTLFAGCFILGIIAVPAGVGGGVLFVPLVASFFPFHLDFVRGAGLMVALAGALSAAPKLLNTGLADLRLALPLALVASASSVAGALIGLALPVAAVQTALGATVLAMAVLMALARRADLPLVRRQDALSRALGLHGIFIDGNTGREFAWQAHRTPQGLALFVAIGILAGMFGLGAGWANVPALNLVMGVPLKVCAGTSSFILSLVDSSAAWIYLHRGAVLPMVAVPSVAGMMLGARIGARLLHALSATVVRRMVIALLVFAGARALAKGLGLWN